MAQSYSMKLKLKAIKEYLETPKNIYKADICKKYGIKFNTFKKWLKIYRENNGTLPLPKNHKHICKKYIKKSKYIVVELTKAFYNNIIDEESFEKLKSIYCK